MAQSFYLTTAFTKSCVFAKISLPLCALCGSVFVRCDFNYTDSAYGIIEDRIMETASPSFCPQSFCELSFILTEFTEQCYPNTSSFTQQYVAFFASLSLFDPASSVWIRLNRTGMAALPLAVRTTTQWYPGLPPGIFPSYAEHRCLKFKAASIVTSFQPS